jgi:hypothetical protein
MQQTLYALAAILALSFFALSRTQDDAALARRSISSEIEAAAENLARTRLAEISRVYFDEGDVGSTRARSVPSTIPLGRDAGETTLASFDDLDDFNDVEAVLGGPDVRGVPVGRGTVQVRLQVAVRYVQPANPTQASAVPTLAKEVVVRATEVVPPGTTPRRALADVTLRTVFTPASPSLRNAFSPS